MRKLLLLICGLTAFAFSASAGTITVDWPGEGCTYFPNPNCAPCNMMKWHYSGIPDTTTVKVLLFQNGVYKAHIKTGVPIAEKGFWVTMPEGVSGANFKIRVQTEEPAGTSTIGDSGSFYYYPATVTVTAPNGGTLSKGSKCLISWQVQGLSAPCSTRIELSSINAYGYWLISPSLGSGVNQYEWIVGKTLAAHSVPEIFLGGGYYYFIIRCYPATGGEIWVHSGHVEIKRLDLGTPQIPH